MYYYWIDVQHYKAALGDMIKGGVSLLLRMRLSCSMWTAEGKRMTKNGIEIGNYDYVVRKFI